MKHQTWLRVCLTLFDGGAAGEGAAAPPGGGAPGGIPGGRDAPPAPAGPGDGEGTVPPVEPTPQAPPGSGEEGSPGREERLEQFRQMEELRRRNTQLLREKEQRLRQDRVSRQTQRWHAEGQATGRIYPQFDMGRELDDPRFRSLLQAGVPVRQAYEVTHMGDITAALARQVARQTEKQVVDAIRAKGSRPAENGTAGQSAFTLKSDVSRLSRRDRAEIARRALRGEKGIRF